MPPLRRPILTVLYLAALSLVAYLAYWGRAYYLTPVPLRPRQELYWTLKPGGDLGILYGMTGTAMMLLMLLYTLRKRVGIFKRLGTLRTWLDAHIFFGVVGPAFIVLHTSFKAEGLVALSFWSMIVVAASGVAGRYFYGQIPRTRAGDELSLAEAAALDEELTRQLHQRFRLSPQALKALEDLTARGSSKPRALPVFLIWALFDATTFHYRLWRFRRELGGVQPELARSFMRTLRQKAHLRRRILLWEQLHRVFHYWHILHKPFAIIMYLFMLVHIGVAWMTGYVG